MTDITQAELQQKIFEMTVLTGQKFMKTKVLEDWTLATDIMPLIIDWHNKQVEEVLDRVESKATEYYDWSKSLEKEVERPFMAVPLERIKKLRSEL